MPVFHQRHLTARRGLPILALAAVSFLGGCRSTAPSGPSSELQSEKTEPKDELENAETFSDVNNTEFNQQRDDDNADFLGCLCVSETADKSKWVAWQFLSVGAKGFRTFTDKNTYDDLEACIAMRETLMECGG